MVILLDHQPKHCKVPLVCILHMCAHLCVCEGEDRAEGSRHNACDQQWVETEREWKSQLGKYKKKKNCKSEHKRVPYSTLTTFKPCQYSCTLAHDSICNQKVQTTCG